MIKNLSAAVLENIKNKTMDSPCVVWGLGRGEKRDFVKTENDVVGQNVCLTFQRASGI